MLIFRFCNNNTGLFSIAPHFVIAKVVALNIFAVFLYFRLILDEFMAFFFIASHIVIALPTIATSLVVTLLCS